MITSNPITALILIFSFSLMAASCGMLKDQEAEDLRKEVADLKGKSDALQAQWQAEKETVGQLQTLREEIEHAKIRRFRDPRIHAALVCGSVSCPTLRREPFSGAGIDAQLEAQMRSFLEHGGAVADRPSNALSLSRVMLWYGGDFTRPNRMPTNLRRCPPASTQAIAVSTVSGCPTIT